MILNFKEHQNQLYDERYAIFEQFTGIDNVFNKVALYQKREMVYTYNLTNESLRYVNKPVQDIHFSIEERESTKVLFEEFIPNIVESFINELEEAGIEFEESFISELGISQTLNEGVMDRIKKALDKVSSKASNVANKVGGAIDNAKEYIKDTAEKINDATKETKEKIVEKYKNIISFLTKVVEKGVNSVKEFITNIAKLFQKLGETVKEALKKLGAFNEEKDEEKADIKIDDNWIDGMTEDKGEETFLSHVIAYVTMMMGNHKETVDKLLTENAAFDFSEDELYEGKLMDKIANNKFMQRIFLYGKNKHFSFWKTALVSITGSLIISLGLPVILPIFGVSAAVVPTVCAAVRIVWSARSTLRIILNRYVNKEPGEKLFDLKTCILIGLSVIPQIPPFKDWFAQAFKKVLEWLHVDKWIGDIGGKLGKLIEKLHGQNPSEEVMRKEWDEVLSEGGGKVRFTNWDQNNAELLQHAKDSGADEKAVSAFDKLLNWTKLTKGSMKIHDGIDKAISEVGDNLNHGYIFDTSTHGANGLFMKAVNNVMDSGDWPGVTTGHIGGETFDGVTHHFAGAMGMIYNASEDFLNACKEEFVKLGGDAGVMDFTEFGKGLAENVVHHSEVITKSVNWLFDSIANSFGVVFIPWFDKNKWGQYKMRFASGTRGAAAYVVDRVEDVKASDIKNVGDSPALQKLVSLHESTWNDVKNNTDNVVNKEETKDVKESKEEKKENKPQEPHYIVFYVRPNQSTKKKEDNPVEKKDEDKDKKDKGKKDETFAGVVIDPLTMLAADVCDFNESTKKRRRKSPYFLKGLFSKLSFAPLDSNDNDTKDYIRKTLGTTMNTLVNICLEVGKGKDYIEIKKDGKNLTYELKKDVDGDKEYPEIGNFTPKEILECIKDESDNHKVAYTYFDGKYGSKISIKFDKKSNKSVLSARKDEDTIENVKYYKVSPEEKEKIEKNVKLAQDNWALKMKPGSKAKKPANAKFIELPNGDVYKKADKKYREEHKDEKLADWVDVMILPLLTDGNKKKGKKELDTTLKDKLQNDEDIKQVLYLKDGKLNMEVIDAIKEFLYRPEKSFAKDDEHDLANKLDKKFEKKKSGLKGIFKKREKLHDTIKRMIEIIWDYILDERRSDWKHKDNKFNTGKTNDSYEYTLFDELIEESFVYEDEEDEDNEEEEEEEKDDYVYESRVLTYDEYLQKNL